jgi:hypothetical protein
LALKRPPNTTKPSGPAGDEVVELYLSFSQSPAAPIRTLRGFTRVHLDAGQHDMSIFDLKRTA